MVEQGDGSYVWLEPAGSFQRSAGTMVFEGEEIVLKKGHGLEVAPQVRHQFLNQSNADVHFLVISVPSTGGDRVHRATRGCPAEGR